MGKREYEPALRAGPCPLRKVRDEQGTRARAPEPVTRMIVVAKLTISMKING